MSNRPDNAVLEEVQLGPDAGYLVFETVDGRLRLTYRKNNTDDHCWLSEDRCVELSSALLRHMR